MFCSLKHLILALVVVLLSADIAGQMFEHHGTAAAWITVNNLNGAGFQAGTRYLPQLLIDIPVTGKLKVDGELSLDSYLSVTALPDNIPGYSVNLNLYRTWLRLSGTRFELRAGLQKINFGSALMLRPLMWFDRIDPRDPLHMTKGVYGLLGKYYFRNNANIWLWSLIGNKDNKGWEIIPSKGSRPEMGGRLQLPVTKGEIALSFHNRIGRIPEDWQLPASSDRYFPENRIAFDMKLDLGPGLWIEGSMQHQGHPGITPYMSSVTIGSDYTFGLLNGLNLTTEHIVIRTGEKLFSTTPAGIISGASLSIPLTIITKASAIVFFDWKNKGWYRYANLSFTFDKLSVNLIGFWNEQGLGIFNFDSDHNMFAGAGGQVMMVYNY